MIVNCSKLSNGTLFHTCTQNAVCLSSMWWWTRKEEPAHAFPCRCRPGATRYMANLPKAGWIQVQLPACTVPWYTPHSTHFT